MTVEAPSVCTSIKDAAAAVTYNVMAYRTLTRPELVKAIRIYLSQAKKKPMRGSSVTIISVIGAND